jgi:serine/threonine protein kinase
MQQLGDYKLIEKIGAGGMGEVYLAENVHMHKRYALKLLQLCVERVSRICGRDGGGLCSR